MTKPRWQQEVEAGVTQLDAEVARRRSVSQHDAVADGISYAVSEVRARIATLTAPGRELSPAEWAAEQDPHVSEQAVRNWIKAGELAARLGPRGFLVLATARREKKAPQREHHAA